MFLLAHLGYAAAPASLAAREWGERRGFSYGAPDMRWLLAGAVLPDLIDKTVGQVLLRPYFQNGRIFTHTVALTLAALLAGAWSWRRRGDGRLLLLACGMASHLVLDRIWMEPTTAFWPSLGPFLRHPSLGTIMEQIREHLTDPFFWAGEVSGGVLLVLSLRVLGVSDRRALGDFIFRGNSPALAEMAVAERRM
ncbi:MAG: metal-dependent hydrolase [Actinomycetota bacterium]|nr:metal-dependent hydrolase [Actinomycetota bacterium]